MKLAQKMMIGLACLSLIACGQNDTAEAEIPEGFESVTVSLETVTRVTWERVDSGFRYQVEADGVELGSGVGDRNYFLHDGPFENLRVAAFNFAGEALGEAQLRSVEQIQRLVLSWDDSAFVRPFLGLRTEDGDGGSSSMALGLDSSPYIIGSNPDHIKVALFGEAVEATDGRIVPSPFSFERGVLVEHGPFIHLRLP